MARYVYVIQEPETKLCKIGVSVNPKERLASLQTANPRPLVLRMLFWHKDSSWLEMRLHSLFYAQHVSGEWFSVLPEQVAEKAREIGAEVRDYAPPTPEPPTARERKHRVSFAFVWGLLFWMHALFMLGYVTITDLDLSPVYVLVLLLYNASGTWALSAGVTEQERLREGRS